MHIVLQFIRLSGSEFDVVILVVPQASSMLLTRNLLYTAITRAKSCVIIVGDERVFEEMCKNQSQTKRYTSLSDRILEYI